MAAPNPVHGRGTKCTWIASACCCGKRRRPVSARCGRCSPGSRALRPFRPFAPRHVRSADRDRPRLLGRLRDPGLRRRHDRDRRRSAGTPAGVERADRDLVGRSLVSIDASRGRGRAPRLPAVAGVSVDRGFPSTLVVKVAPERPVAVIRRGTSAWLATGAGKVIREIAVGTEKGCPLWVRRGATIRVGGQIPARPRSARRARSPRRTRPASRAA